MDMYSGMACVLVSISGEMRSKYLISRQNRLQVAWKCQGPSGFRKDVGTRNTQWKLLDVGLRSIRTCPDLNHPISHRPDVPTGTYVLSVLSHDYSFDQVCTPFLTTSGAHNVYQVRIDVSPEEPLPHVQSYTFGTPLLTKSSVSLPYPVVLIPRHKNVYFSPRESFNLLGMFQSPMMMIMVLTGGMMLAMPYIMVSLYRHGFPSSLCRCRKTWTLRRSTESRDSSQKLQAFKISCKVEIPEGKQPLYANHGLMLISNRLSALLDADEPSTPAVKSSPGPSTAQQRKGGKGNRRR